LPLDYPERSMSASLPPARHHYTYEEYLTYEHDSDRKHEFDTGEIFAKAGGSPRHSALASRISAGINGPWTDRARSRRPQRHDYHESHAALYADLPR
jgi:hypothetical protein